MIKESLPKMNIMLIHGQSRTLLSMGLLGWRLSRQGYNVRYFGYFAFLQTFEDITRRFVQKVRDEINPEPYAIVGHSLGAIIARASLPQLKDNPPRHLIMLAPPNQPPMIAKKVRRNPVYRWLTQDCGRRLADDAFYEKLPRPTVPTTIIAGGRGWPKLISPFGDAINDGILAAAETELGEGYQVILARATHPLIMNSKDVARLITELAAVE